MNRKWNRKKIVVFRFTIPHFADSQEESGFTIPEFVESTQLYVRQKGKEMLAANQDFTLTDGLSFPLKSTCAVSRKIVADCSKKLHRPFPSLYVRVQLTLRFRRRARSRSLPLTAECNKIVDLIFRFALQVAVYGFLGPSLNNRTSDLIG